MRREGEDAQVDISVYERSNLQRIRKIQRNFSGRLPKPKVEKTGLSVIIINFDKLRAITALCKQLEAEAKKFAQKNIGFEVIIRETGSRDQKSLPLYRRLEKKGILRFIGGLKSQSSRNHNQIANKYAQFDTLVFVDGGIILDRDHQTLWRMYNEHRKSSGKDIIGAYLKNPDQTIRHAGVFFSGRAESLYVPYHAAKGDRLPANKLKNRIPVPAVTGALMMVSGRLFYAAGRFDEEFNKEYQDISFCLSGLRLGARTLLCNVGQVIHRESPTGSPSEVSLQDRASFLRKWSSYLEAGPL